MTVVPPEGGWGDEPTAVAPPPPPPPVGPPPEAEPGNRIGLGMLLAIGVLAAVAAVLAAVLLTRHHHHNPAVVTSVVVTTTAPATTTTRAHPVSIPVPDLVGRPWKDALAGLRNAGFHVTIATVPSALPRGTVVAQHPSSGSLAKGSNVRLNISNGAAKSSTTAPTHTTTTQPSTTASVTTSTAAQTTTAATTTTATTSSSSAPKTSATVPTLSGELQPALQRLDAAGLVASLAYVPGTQPLGTVVAQSPAASSSAPAGSQVTVNVSSGPNGNPIETVPNVVGQRIPQAVPTLQHAGLRLIFLRAKVSDRSKAGVIVAQTPLPGKHAPKNAQVLVYMGAYQG